MQMSKAETEADIEAVLDKPDNMAIVNCSKWSPTQPITPVTKTSLLQELIYDEVVDKRRKQIAGLRKGLQQFDMISLLKCYPTKLGRAFVYHGSLLDASKLLSLIDLNTKGFTEKQECIVKWFTEYIECRATENRGQSFSPLCVCICDLEYTRSYIAMHVVHTSIKRHSCVECR